MAECLCALSYQERLKIYIPGENTYNLKKRLVASELGVVIVLQQFATDFKAIPEIESMISITLSNLELVDVEAQLQILQYLKSQEGLKNSKYSLTN